MHIKKYSANPLDNTYKEISDTYAGLEVPAPQVFYQNLIGKKPEFSGKPEEDVESHLLSTRDWMEVHNFPKEVKVRCFHFTLIGEAICSMNHWPP